MTVFRDTNRILELVSEQRVLLMVPQRPGSGTGSSTPGQERPLCFCNRGDSGVLASAPEAAVCGSDAERGKHVSPGETSLRVFSCVDSPDQAWGRLQRPDLESLGGLL